MNSSPSHIQGALFERTKQRKVQFRLIGRMSPRQSGIKIKRFSSSGRVCRIESSWYNEAWIREKNEICYFPKG